MFEDASASWTKLGKPGVFFVCCKTATDLSACYPHSIKEYLMIHFVEGGETAYSKLLSYADSTTRELGRQERFLHNRQEGCMYSVSSMYVRPVSLYHLPWHMVGNVVREVSEVKLVLRAASASCLAI